MDLLDSTNRDMLGVIIEKVLLGISTETHSFVEKKLQNKYHCKFANCYEHPEFLYNVLREFYGNNYTEIIKKITAELERHTLDHKLEKFIEAMTCRET